jgi:hypothetical protein
MRLRRVIISSLCALPVVIGLYLWIAVVDDEIMPQDPPHSVIWSAFTWCCMVALWPLLIAIYGVLHHDPPAVCWPLLWVFAAFFWGLIAEVVFVAKARLCPIERAGGDRG